MINNNLKRVTHDFSTNSFEVETDVADFYVKSNILFNISINKLLKDNYYFLLYIDNILISLTNKFEFDNNLGLWRIIFFANDIILPMSKISKKHRKIKILAFDYNNDGNCPNKFDMYNEVFYRVGQNDLNFKYIIMGINYPDSQLKRDCKNSPSQLYFNTYDLAFGIKNIDAYNDENEAELVIYYDTITLPWKTQQCDQPEKRLVLQPVRESPLIKESLSIKKSQLIDKYQKLIPNLIDLIKIAKASLYTKNDFNVGDIYFAENISEMTDDIYINTNFEHVGFSFGISVYDKTLYLPNNVKTFLMITSCQWVFPEIMSSNLESLCLYNKYLNINISNLTNLKGRLPQTVTNITLIDSCACQIDLNELPTNIKTLTIIGNRFDYVIKNIPVTVDFIIYNPLSINIFYNGICTIKIARHLANKLLIVNDSEIRVDVIMLD